MSEMILRFIEAAEKIKTESTTLILFYLSLNNNTTL